MKSAWIVLLCLLGAVALTALLVWYFEQRMLARSLARGCAGRMGAAYAAQAGLDG